MADDRVCACGCGVSLEGRTSRAKWATDRCRKRGSRSPVGKVVELAPAPERRRWQGPVEKATERELREADRLDSPLGQTCLVLARRLDVPGADTGSALATLAVKLEALLASATRGTGAKNKPQQLRDELAERRAQHA